MPVVASGAIARKTAFDKHLQRAGLSIAAVGAAFVLAAIGYTCFHPYIVDRPGWFFYIGEEQWGNTYDPGIRYDGDTAGGWLAVRIVNFQYGIKWSTDNPPGSRR